MSSFRPVVALMLLPLLACGDEEEETFEIRFEARAGQQAITCGASYPDMGNPAGTVRIRDFRVFVSNVRLVAPDGAETPLSLDQDGIWQFQNVALLDFEDGSATCSETGNSSQNQTVRGRADVETVSGVRFDLGLPFSLNHLDLATQPSPLNLTSMHWNWRGGYKFIRIDLETTQAAPDNKFNLHLGSTACGTPNQPTVTPPTQPCGRPNLPTIALDGFDPASNTVVLDLAGLLTGVDTSTNTPGSPPGCMSAPSEPVDCNPVFSNLGLSFDTGACTSDCAGQRFVRAE